MSRADRVVLARPGAELTAENVITVPIPCRPFVVEHLGKKHGDYVPRCRMRQGQVHVRLTTGQVLTDVADITARLQAVHHLISRHDILLELEEVQAVTHMVGKEYRIGDRSFRPRQTPLRLSGAESTRRSKLTGRGGLRLFKRPCVLHSRKAWRATLGLRAKCLRKTTLFFARCASGANITEALLLSARKSGRILARHASPADGRVITKTKESHVLS
ncbi:MAG: hypothetical protein EBS59_03725 [Verrucomicrobia bacterium]|nr:hypothetical protein [Verrucomicrobiota bacterium]